MNAFHPPLFASDRTYVEPPKRKPSFMTTLAKAANEDTPQNVDVPATIPGITQWVLGKWGPWGAILIFACVILWLYVGSNAQTTKILQDQIVQQQKEID